MPLQWKLETGKAKITRDGQPERDEKGRGTHGCWGLVEPIQSLKRILCVAVRREGASREARIVCLELGWRNMSGGYAEQWTWSVFSRRIGLSPALWQTDSAANAGRSPGRKTPPPPCAARPLRLHPVPARRWPRKRAVAGGGDPEPPAGAPGAVAAAVGKLREDETLYLPASNLDLKNGGPNLQRAGPPPPSGPLSTAASTSSAAAVSTSSDAAASTSSAGPSPPRHRALRP